MFHNPNLNQTGDDQHGNQHGNQHGSQHSNTRNSNSVPIDINREPIAVVDGRALDGLASWLENELQQLLDRNLDFESPSSRKKYFSR